MRRLAALLVLVALLGAVFAFSHRRILVIRAAGLVMEVPGLLPPADEGPGVRWADDYFTVEALGPRTFAIGEPRFYQQNFNYLIIGSERAVLFDAGPGIRDIRPVAESLTDLPVTFVPSHFHYDHLGAGISFASVAVVDLPALRARAPDGLLRLTAAEHLGFAEGFALPTLAVTEWLAPGSLLSLGDRQLRVLYTPGHTDDSISLLDLETGLLFAGDFIYPGPLFAFLPNSRLGDYLAGAETVLEASAGNTRLFGAHRVGPPGLPELGMDDVRDLAGVLQAVRDGEMDGEGVYPVVYPINERVSLMAEPRWLQRWNEPVR